MRFCAALKANFVWNIINIFPLSWTNRTILLSISKRKYWNYEILPNAKNKIKLHKRYMYIWYIQEIYIIHIYVYKTNQAQAYNKKKNVEGKFFSKNLNVIGNKNTLSVWELDTIQMGTNFNFIKTKRVVWGKRIIFENVYVISRSYVYSGNNRVGTLWPTVKRILGCSTYKTRVLSRID